MVYVEGLYMRLEWSDIQKQVGTVILSYVIFKKKLETLKGKLN